MKWVNKSNVLIVGLGLMGGSYAKAIKRIGHHVLAIDKDKEAIEYGLENGIIDEGASFDDPELIKKADCIIIALYPSIVVKWISENKGFFKKGIKITDVMGVKSSFLYKVQEELADTDVEYISAHPMAGREVWGVKNASDKIFRDANYIVVPTDKNTEDGIMWCENLGRVLGFYRVSILSPEEHDDMIAYVSQLTHCIAVSLMTCEDSVKAKDYTGDSFRDLTRIANINGTMWSELFLLNKDALLGQIDKFMSEMGEIRSMIEKDDREGLKDKMRLSTERRSQFNKE